MVWEYISVTGVAKICILKRSINFAVYQDFLDHFRIPNFDDKFGDNEFIFHPRTGERNLQMNSSSRRGYLYLISLQIEHMQNNPSNL